MWFFNKKATQGKQKEGNLHLILSKVSLTVVVSILSVVAVLLLGLDKNQAFALPFDIPNSYNYYQAIALQTADNKNGFLTYQNSQYGFKIQYPSNWEITTCTFFNCIALVTFDSSPIEPGKLIKGARLFIDIENASQYLDTKNMVLKNKTAYDYVQDELKALDHGAMDSHDRVNSTTVGGVKAWSIQSLSDVSQLFDRVTYMVKNGKMYQFHYLAPSLKVPSTLPIAQKMINSFQFTGNNTLANNRSSEVASNTKSLTMPNNTNSNKTNISSSSSSASVSNSANVNRTINENIGTNTSAVSKTSTTVTSIQTTMTLLDDAIQALHEKNNDKALVHLNLIRQNLASLLSSITSPPLSNLTASRSFPSTQAAVRPQTEDCKTLPASKAAGATTSSAKSSPVQQIPSTASDFKNHDPCTITLDFLKVSLNLLNDYELKGELTNTGKQTLNGFRIHMHWYDKDMNIVGFNDGQNGVYSPSDTIAPRQTISFDFRQSGTNDFTGVPAFLKLSYDWR